MSEPMDIDDSRPLTGNANSTMYEFEDDGASASATTVDNRPLNVRIGDKNWKTRLAAYEELKNELNAADNMDVSFFEEFAPWLPKMTSDSNAGALDAGVDFAVIFADKCPSKIILPYYDALFQNVVDKAFAGKTSTFLKGKALLMKLMEIDEPTSCTLFLLSRLQDKKPKIPPACLEIIREAIVAFGAKAFPIKDIISSFNSSFNSSNNQCREQAFLLLAELVRWIGKSPFLTIIENLRPAQKTELEKLFSESESSSRPVPTVYLRKSRPAPGSIEASAPISGKSGKLPSAAPDDVIDGRDFLEEIDLSKRLKNTEFFDLMENEKWSEQLRGLQLLIDILGPTPKLKPGNDTSATVSDVCSHLKNFLRAGHLQVQVSTLKIFALFADGFRESFTNLVKPQISLILTKAKEKRLVSDVLSALVAITRYCISSIEVLLEDCLDLIRNKKHPSHARTCIMEYLAAIANAVPQVILSDHFKPLVEALGNVADDPDPKVRDAGANTLSFFLPVIKSRGKSAQEAMKLLLSFESVHPRFYKKIFQEATTMTEETSSQGSAEVKKAPSTSAAKAPVKPVATKSVSSTAKASSSTASSKAATSANPPSSTKQAALDDENFADESNSSSIEDIIAALAVLGIEGWESTFQEDIVSAKWQDKVSACTVLSQALLNTQLGGKLSSQIFAYLSMKTNQFKISNISVIKAFLQVLSDMIVSALSSAEKNSFSKFVANEILKIVADKISDKKMSDIVNNILSGLAEIVSLSFVIKRMKVILDKSKIPTTHQYYLEWLKIAIQEFSVKTCPVQILSIFLLIETENKNNQVRTAAIEVFGEIYSQIGPKLLSIVFSDDMKPQIKSSLEAEFEKVGYDPKNVRMAVRGPYSNIASAGDPGNPSASEKVSASEFDIPRQDLCSLLDKNILSELSLLEGKTSWTNRKTAMESIIAACEKSGHYLDCQQKNSIEIIKVLKARLQDTQANLKPIAALALGHVCCSIEIDVCAKILKIVASGLLETLADNKKSMRDSGVQAMNMCVTQKFENLTTAVGESTLIALFISPSVESLANPIGRQELLQFFTQHLEGIKADCSDLCLPCVNCMQDKTAMVRSLAEYLLVNLISRGLVTKAVFEKSTRDLPNAVKRTLQPSLDRMVAAFNPAQRGNVLSQLAGNEKAASREEKGSGNPGLLQKAPSQYFSDDATVATQGSVSQSRWSLKKTTKIKRLEEFYKSNWPVAPEDVTDAEFITLKSIWENLISPDLANIIFASNLVSSGPNKNQDMFVPAMTALTEQLDGPYALLHTDLLLRYAAYVLCLRETSNGLLKVLQLIFDVLGVFIKASQHFAVNESVIPTAISGGVAIHDAEVSIILFHLLERCGHKSDRHKQAFKNVIIQASLTILPSSRYVSFLVQFLLSQGKNRKSKITVVEEMQRILEESFQIQPNPVIFTKAHLKDFGGFFETKDLDTATKSACLEFLYSLYLSLNSDFTKLIRLLGGGSDTALSERSVSSIEERIKQKTKSSVAQVNAAGTNLPSPYRRNMSIHSNTLATVAAVGAAVAELSAMEISSPLPASLTMPQSAAQRMFSPMDIDEDNSSAAPFQLVMTPQKKRAASPLSPTSSYDIGRNVALPKTMETGISLVNVYGPDGYDALRNLDFNLQGLYLDIAVKMDTYCYNVHSNSYTTENEKYSKREEIMDYIKILHEMSCGQWYKTASKSEANQIPADVTECFVIRLTKCISVGFEKPTFSYSKMYCDIPIDVNFLSIALATLFQILKNIKNKSILKNHKFSFFANYFILKIVLGKLIDERLTKVPENLSAESVKMVENISKGLNMIALIVCNESEFTTNACNIRCLLRILLECALSEQSVAMGVVDDKNRYMPPIASQPSSRLLLHVLSNEVSRNEPFQDNSFDMKAVLLELHEFYIKHPLLHVENDRPFRCAKTVLNEIVKNVSTSVILGYLNELGVPNSSFIYKLTGKLGQSVPNMDRNLASSPTISSDSNEKILRIMDEITSAQNKLEPIQKLHELKLQHPELELSPYLQRISAAFRRFVTDTLNKLSENENQASVSNSSNTNNVATRTLSTMSASADKPNTADEALRILEGLRNVSRSTSTRQISMQSPPNPPAKSTPVALPPHLVRSSLPRSQISDKVMGSLNSLSASLDLQKTATTPTAASLNMQDEDSDLTSRVSKLVSHFNK